MLPSAIPLKNKIQHQKKKKKPYNTLESKNNMNNMFHQHYEKKILRVKDFIQLMKLKVKSPQLC